MENHEDNH